MDTFDAIIIGIGQAGNPLSSALAEQGYKVAVIEREHPGGSCINYGCTPTKAMVASAHVSHTVDTAKAMGVKVSDKKINFKKIIKRRDGIVKSWKEGIEKRMKTTENIEYLFGEATFTGEKQVEVKLKKGKEKRSLTADKIFINVGTSAFIPSIPGLDQVNYLTSKTMMKLKELPEHLIIIGGGYISLEFGQIYRRLGSKVTIIQQDSQLASREDEDVAQAIQEFLEKEGVEIHLKAKKVEVEKTKKGIRVKIGNKKNKISGSHLLVAVGTMPNTAVLSLDQTRVKTDDHGYIQVNNYLETNVKGIFALGDCKGGPEFTHISYDDFRIVNDYLFGDKKRKVNDRMVPYTLFTKPELGRIGLTEKQAKDEKVTYKIAKMPMESAARAIEANQTTGLLKVLVDPEKGKILGAACLAEIGGDMMAMLQIAMMGKLTYQQLRDGIFAHPTYAEVLNNLFGKLEDPQ